MKTRQVTDNRERIFNNSLHAIRRIDGHTVFGGCICTKSCKCEHDFVSEQFTEYRVTKKWGKSFKPMVFSSKQAAYKQMRELTKAHKKWKDEQSTKSNN